MKWTLEAQACEALQAQNRGGVTSVVETRRSQSAHADHIPDTCSKRTVHARRVVIRSGHDVSARECACSSNTPTGNAKVKSRTCGVEPRGKKVETYSAWGHELFTPPTAAADAPCTA